MTGVTSNHGSQQPTVVAWISDLFFMSMVATAARRLSVSVVFIKPGDPVPDGARLGLLDLQIEGPWENDVRSVRERGGVVIAFGPHVDLDSRARARHAGCSRVLAKSRFRTELPDLLASCLCEPSPSTPATASPPA